MLKLGKLGLGNYFLQNQLTDDSALHTEAAFGPPCKTSTMGATFMKAKTDNVKEVPCGPAPRNFPPKSNVMNLSKQAFGSAQAMLASTFALISAAFKVVLVVVVGVVRCCCLRRKGTVKRAPARGTTYFVTLSCLFFCKKSQQLSG